MEPGLEKFLKPVSQDAPAGPELRMEGRELLARLEADWHEQHRKKLEGDGYVKPQDPVEVDWQEIRQTSLEHLSISRDLRVAMIYALAETKLRGLAGLKSGLELMAGLLDQLWDHLHPVMEDASDDERARRIEELGASPFNESAYQYVRYLADSIFLRSKLGSGYSIADLQAAYQGKPSAGGKIVTLEELRQAASDSGENYLSSMNVQVRDALAALNTIKTTLEGRQRAVDVKALEDVLQNLSRFIVSVEEPSKGTVAQNNRSPSNPETAQPPSNYTSSAIPKGIPMNGVINSRADVEQALKAICEYYRRNEPGSPVPLLLERAARLVNRSFMESMEDLAPDALEKFRMLFGVK